MKPIEVIITSARKKEIIDITDIIQTELEKSKVKSGLCTATVLHTTCALTTADLDPGTDLDMLDAFAALTPDLAYRHPHNPSREHVGSHIMASIIGPSVSLPFANNELMLGTWQRIILIELSGARERNLIITIR